MVLKNQKMTKPQHAQEAIEKALGCIKQQSVDEAMNWLNVARKSGPGRKMTAALMLERVLEDIQYGDAPEESWVSEILTRISRMEQLVNRSNSALGVSESSGDHKVLQQLESLRQTYDNFLHDAMRVPRMTLAELNQLWLENLKLASVSQLGQDLWILERTSYKRGGYFVEFGATDGISLSNTYLLERAFGWRGICAEPNPNYFAELVSNRLCTTACECIGPLTGETVDFVFASEYGAMLRDADKDSHWETRKMYVNAGKTGTLTTISLDDFLLKHSAPRTIDYISIDTEGSEYSILETFPFDQWDVRHLSVEHNFTEQRESVRTLLLSHGYQVREMDWDDWYFRDV